VGGRVVEALPERRIDQRRAKHQVAILVLDHAGAEGVNLHLEAFPVDDVVLPQWMVGVMCADVFTTRMNWMRMGLVSPSLLSLALMDSTIVGDDEVCNYVIKTIVKINFDITI
jgi:hypothetical protein